LADINCLNKCYPELNDSKVSKQTSLLLMRRLSIAKQTSNKLNCPVLCSHEKIFGCSLN